MSLVCRSILKTRGQIIKSRLFLWDFCIKKQICSVISTNNKIKNNEHAKKGNFLNFSSIERPNNTVYRDIDKSVPPFDGTEDNTYDEIETRKDISVSSRNDSNSSNDNKGDLEAEDNVQYSERVEFPKLSNKQAADELNFIDEAEYKEYLKNETKTNILEPCKEDVSYVAPHMYPSFNFAVYINKSPTLQQLLALGVDFYKLECSKNIPQFLVQLNFEKDIEPYIRFLTENGVPKERLGRYISKNPSIFKEDLNDLQVRINYLKSKKFTPEMIATIIDKNPFWLSRSTKHIDEKFGYLQKLFHLNGGEIRHVATICPALITNGKQFLTRIRFTVKEEMGFSSTEMKQLIINEPKIFTTPRKSLRERFYILHTEMGVPHDIICQHSVGLLRRTYRIRERHRFLKALGRDQYDPKKENFVSPTALATGNDFEFCTNVAKASVETFNMFLKTM